MRVKSVVYCCSHPARLYKSLGEYDVLHGVFSGHIGAETVTKEALAAEERGDYKGALDQYKEVLRGVWCNCTTFCCMVWLLGWC